MRIGFFTDTYLPNIDGVVGAMLGYRRELEARGNKVCIFTSGDSKAKAQNKDRRVFYFDSVPFPPYPQYKIALFPLSMTGRVRKANLDIVHSHAITSMGIAAIKASKDLGLPLVGTFHTMVPIAAKYYTRHNRVARLLADRLMWGAIRTFYGPFDLVTAPTETVRKILEEKGVEHTFTVPNGVDTVRFNPGTDPRPMRTMLGLEKDERLIVTAGRLSFEKNVDMIIQSCRILIKRGENFRMVITGDGPARDSVKSLISKHNLEDKIILVGFCKPFELPYYYSAADVFVTASAFETQGLAMLEAMACGKPVVGADSLAIPESVKNDANGYLFRPHDAGDCADQIEKIFHSSPAKYARLSKGARRTAEGLSVEKSTERLLEAYSLVR